MQRIPCRNLTDVFERIVDIPAGIACCRCNIPIALHLQHPSGFALPTIELALHLQHSSWHCTYQLLNWRCTCNIPTGIAPATHNVILAVAIAAINCVCTCNFPIANFDSNCESQVVHWHCTCMAALCLLQGETQLAGPTQQPISSWHAARQLPPTPPFPTPPQIPQHPVPTLTKPTCHNQASRCRRSIQMPKWVHPTSFLGRHSSTFSSLRHAHTHRHKQSVGYLPGVVARHPLGGWAARHPQGGVARHPLGGLARHPLGVAERHPLGVAATHPLDGVARHFVRATRGHPLRISSSHPMRVPPSNPVKASTSQSLRALVSRLMRQLRHISSTPAKLQPSLYTEECLWLLYTGSHPQSITRSWHFL